MARWVAITRRYEEYLRPQRKLYLRARNPKTYGLRSDLLIRLLSCIEVWM
jgi:hypothetical protein